MSHNLTLHATVEAVLSFKGDVKKPCTIAEPIRLWQTPTEVTETIMGFATHEERLAAYKRWALLRETPKHQRITWDDNDPTLGLDFDGDGNQIIVGKSVRQSIETVGEAHVRELDETLARYEDWDFEWSWE